MEEEEEEEEVDRRGYTHPSNWLLHTVVTVNGRTVEVTRLTL